jgi:Zn-dependent protease with chaperone function
MTEFDAVYYDGKTSARKPVRVRGYPGILQIVGESLRLEVGLDRVEVDAPVGAGRRSLRLPGGAQLQTDDHAAVEALFPRAHFLEGKVHALERRWPVALGAIALLAGFGWWCVVDGLPRAAKLAAELMPPEMEASLGEQTLRSLDGPICRPSALEPARQQALQRSFETLTAGLGDGFRYKLEPRDCSELGPNAFALPGGRVVLTDALVKLAANDAQISAVLAHEIGHVRNRHALRAALQATGVAVLVSTLAGDAGSITSLAVTLPTTLLQSGYSREFETEADDYAFQRLREVGISPAAFAEIMTLFQKEQAKRPGDNSRDYFSTHPATAKRIERARAAASP